MSASTRLQVRTKALTWAFAIYASLNLISMATMSIGAGVLALAIVLTSGGSRNLLEEVKSEWNSSPSRVFLILSLLLTTACAISLLGGLFFPLSYGGKYSEVHFFPDMAKCWYLFWPGILVIGLRRLNDSSRKIVFQSWLVTFACLSVIGIIQYFTGWPRAQFIPGEENHYHAILFLGHHLSVASILIFPFFAMLEYALVQPPKKSPLYWGAALLGCITLFLTYSRTLWVALPIGIFIWTLWATPKKWKNGALLLVVLALGVASQLPLVQRRLHQSMGIGTRTGLWWINYEFFKQRPLTGVGLKHNQELSGIYQIVQGNPDPFIGHAHNNFIDMLAGLGLTGAILWVCWSLWVFRITLSKAPRFVDQSLPQSGRPLAHELNIARGLFCAWIVFQINGLTQVNFWEGKVQHQMAWVIAWTLLCYR